MQTSTCNADAIENPPGTVAVFTDLLSSEYPPERSWAARELGRLGANACAAIPYLRESILFETEEEALHKMLCALERIAREIDQEKKHV